MPAATTPSAPAFASPEAAREVANLHELIYRASERVDDLMRGDAANEDMTAFALFAADVIHGEGVFEGDGLTEHKIGLVFRAITKATR